MSEPTANAADERAARRKQAIELAGQGRFDEAGVLFDALLAEQPGDVDALNFLAVRAHSAGRPDEALELLARARGAHPRDATTLVNIGVLLRERDQLDEAIAALSDALRIEPGLYVARLRLGEALQARGEVPGDLPAGDRAGLSGSGAEAEVPLFPGPADHALLRPRTVSLVRGTRGADGSDPRGDVAGDVGGHRLRTLPRPLRRHARAAGPPAWRERRDGLERVLLPSPWRAQRRQCGALPADDRRARSGAAVPRARPFAGGVLLAADAGLAHPAASRRHQHAPGHAPAAGGARGRPRAA